MSIIKRAARRIKQKLSGAYQGLRLRLRRLFYRLKHDYLTFDNIVIAAGAILCIYWTWGGISAMSRNWELEQRLDTRRKELTLLQLEVENLELENEYLRSEEYQELAARRQQNKMFEGESMVYLPANSAVAKNKYQQIEEADPVPPSNFEQWMSFLFGS